MEAIKVTITEQLQRLQMLMHRTSFHGYHGKGKGHNPHRGQGRVLTLLKLKPEISQKELSYLLNMSKQALAELLSKLEKSGYITREASLEDKRVMIVKLTEEGLEAAKTIDEEDSGTDMMFSSLNEEELKLFSEFLERIIKSYEAQFPEMDFEQRRQMRQDFMEHRGHHGCGHHHGWHHCSKEEK